MVSNIKFISMNNFKPFKDDDYGSYTSVRQINGRVTKNRIKTIEAFIERYNQDNRYPYGQGYSCGHIHDCCGCLVSTSMSMDVFKESVKIYLQESYNF